MKLQHRNTTRGIFMVDRKVTFFAATHFAHKTGKVVTARNSAGSAGSILRSSRFGDQLEVMCFREYKSWNLSRWFHRSKAANGIRTFRVAGKDAGNRRKWPSIQ